MQRYRFFIAAISIFLTNIYVILPQAAAALEMPSKRLEQRRALEQAEIANQKALIAETRNLYITQQTTNKLLQELISAIKKQQQLSNKQMQLLSECMTTQRNATVTIPTSK